MYVLNHNKALFALRAFAVLVVVTLVAWTLGIAPFSQRTNAGNVTNVSDTLSDTDIGVVSNHTIQFTIPNGMNQGDTFTITFEDFDLTNVLIGDVDLATSSNDQALAGAAGVNTWGYSKSGNVITFTTPTNHGVPSSTPITVRIGTNASGGVNQIINPASPGSKRITIGGTMQDSGETQVAILDDVLVTADVPTSFTFTVYGLDAGTEVNGTTTTATSTPTTIPFGTLADGVIVTLAHDLTVATNAIGGFVVTVFQDATGFISTTGADIDGFIDGAWTNTPSPWQAPDNDYTNENTWGHWGLTSEDDLNANEFGSNLWVSPSTTPRQIFEHDDPADGFTPNVGSTTIGYQVQITALQEAADDYRATLTYVATPTF